MSYQPDDEARAAETRHPIEVLIGLVKAVPDWLIVTIDHADLRPGGYVVGERPERLVCANAHSKEELGLLGGELRAFAVEEDPAFVTLRRARRIRALDAARHIQRRRSPGTAPPLVEFHPGEVVEVAKGAGDDAIEPGIALLHEVLMSLPRPWFATRVGRSSTSGGLWAAALSQEGDLVLGSHDVEARRSGRAPTVAWLPPAGAALVRGILLDQFEDRILEGRHFPRASPG